MTPTPESRTPAPGMPGLFDNQTEACRHCPTPDVHPTRIGGVLTYEGRCDPETCERHDHATPDTGLTAEVDVERCPDCGLTAQRIGEIHITAQRIARLSASPESRK